MEAKLRPGVLARLSSVVIFSWLLFGWAQIFGLPPGIEDAHAAVAQDSFTEASATFLENHTPDTGTGWTISSQGPETWEISAKESNHADEKSGSPNVVRENTDIGTDVMAVTLVVNSTQCSVTNAWGGLPVAFRRSLRREQLLRRETHRRREG